MLRVLVIVVASSLAGCAGTNTQAAFQSMIKNCQSIEASEVEPVPVNPAWSTETKEWDTRFVREFQQEMANECWQDIHDAARELGQVQANYERQNRENQVRNQIEDQQREIEQLQIDLDGARLHEE
jgi:TolA-binding protein